MKSTANIHGTSGHLHLGPPLRQASAAVILLHGRGSSGDDIAGLVDALPARGAAFLAPSAANGSWYPQRFLAPLASNEPWLSSALRVVGELIDDVMAAGVPRDHIGLLGFSQGACLVLEYALRHPFRYGFVAGLSGAAIGPIGTVRPEVDLRQTPVLIGCAEEDAHIPAAAVLETANLFARSRASVTRQTFPGSAHTVFPEEIAWLCEQIDRLASQVRRP